MVSPVIRCHPQQTATAQIWGFKNPKPESIPNYAQYIAKKMGGIVPFLAVWLMIPLNANPLVKKGLEPTLKWGIHRGPGEFRLTHGARDVTME